MYKHGGNKPSSNEPRDEGDVRAVLNKIQQQLIYLERKIDILINQPSSGGAPKPANRYGGKSSGGYGGGRPERKSFVKPFGGVSASSPKAYGEKRNSSHFSGGKSGFAKAKKKFVSKRPTGNQ